MILECDFDTPLPSIDDLEENEEWSVEKSLGELSPPAPGRMMSCFNATAVLCMCVTAILFMPKAEGFFFYPVDIFGRVIQSLYAIRPTGSLATDAAILEGALDKWYLDLPDHLQYDLGSLSDVSSSSKPLKKPLPNVLALHMHYWAIVLILHRPLWVMNIFSSSFIHFYIGLSSIAHLLHRKEKRAEDEDPQTRTKISRNYEMCRTAAIHVATLFSVYHETYLFERCSALLIYCLFSAAILLDADGVFLNSEIVCILTEIKYLNIPMTHKPVSVSRNAKTDSMTWALFGHQLGEP